MPASKTGAKPVELPGHAEGAEEAEEDGRPAEQRGGLLVDPAVVGRLHRADAEGEPPEQRGGADRDQERDDDDGRELLQVVAHRGGGLQYGVNLEQRATTSSRTAASSASSSRPTSTRWISAAIVAISASPMPWVVTAGVPIRRPEVM